MYTTSLSSQIALRAHLHTCFASKRVEQKTETRQLGATIIDGLTGGNLKLPRVTVGRTASWLPETGPGTDADQSFDSFTIIPKRISGSTVVSRQFINRVPTSKLSLRTTSRPRSGLRSITPRSTAQGQHHNRSASCIIPSTRAGRTLPALSGMSRGSSRDGHDRARSRGTYRFSPSF
jgi:hypothetical protein